MHQGQDFRTGQLKQENAITLGGPEQNAQTVGQFYSAWQEIYLWTLQNLNMLSVNQLAASIKLTEAWKMGNIEDYPLQLEKNYENSAPTGRSVRQNTAREWNKNGNFSAAK